MRKTLKLCFVVLSLALLTACESGHRPAVAGLRPEPPEEHADNHGVLFFGSDQWLSYIRVNGEHETVTTRFPDGTTEESEPWDSIKDLALSPDGRTLTYVGTRGKASHFVVDGKAGPPYREINTSTHTVFSNDGRHWAYTASPDEHREVVVHDGIEDPFDIGTSARPLFSPKSGKLIYRASNGEIGPDKTRSFVVIDGKAGKEYHYIVGAIQLKADTDEPVYVAQQGKTRFVVVGESEGKDYQNAYQPHISTDGKTVAYIADEGPRKSMVVVNGVEAAPPSCCIDDRAIVMDPDGKRIGYPAGDKAAPANGTNHRYLLNGIASSQVYEWIKDAILTPPEATRARAAFIAEKNPFKDPRSVVVVDDTMGPEYKLTRDLRFLADGSLFYVAEDGQKAFPVHETEPGPKFDKIRDFTISADGKALAFCGLRNGEAYLVRWNGMGWTESRPYDNIASPILFNASGEAVYRAARIDKQFVVIGEQEQTPYDEIHDVRLGLGGRGMLVVASVGRKMLLVLGGGQIATHEGIGDLGTPEKYRSNDGRQEVQTAAGRVNTFAARDTYYLQLNDRTIFTRYPSFTGGNIEFHGRTANEDVLVLGVYNGDGCPGGTVLIAIKSGATPFVSEPFGDCHTAPFVKTFPDRVEMTFQDENRHFTERWVYRPGASTPLAKVAPTR